MLIHAYGCIDMKFMIDVNLFVENIIIHVFNKLHVVLILHVICYRIIAFHMHGDIAPSHMCVQGIGYSPFLVNV